MRPLAGLIVLAVLASPCRQASAEPVPGPGFAAKVVRMNGAIFSGLADDNGALLITNLADGRLYRWTAASGFSAFGPALPHGLDVIGDPTGPYNVAPWGDHYLVAQGWTPVDQDPGPDDHAVIEVDDRRIVRRISDDFWNPFRFAAAGQAVYVIDAARNSLEHLTLAGVRSEIFTFARLRQQESALKALSPTEFSGAASYEFDAVPTGIALHAGRIYMSLFAGFPFLAGAGKVVSLDQSDPVPTMRIEREGLNAPIDVGFDLDKRMLVLEHGTYDQSAGFEPGSGRLIAFDDAPADPPQVLLSGLTRPVSLIVRDDATIVVCGLDGTIVVLSRSDALHRSGKGGTQ